MSRIALGDVVFGTLLTGAIVLAVVVVLGLIMFPILGLSSEQYYLTLMVTLFSLFLGGGLILGLWSRRAGISVISSWVYGIGTLLVVALVILFITGMAPGESMSQEVQEWLGFQVALLLAGLLFIIGLAGFLNVRYQTSGYPTRRFRGTRPGGMFTSVTIYKSNQPAIYEGIRDLDFDDKAPGSLYRRRQ